MTQPTMPLSPSVDNGGSDGVASSDDEGIHLPSVMTMAKAATSNDNDGWPL